MALKLKTPPATTPITVAEVKDQSNIEHTDKDGLLDGYIATAVSKLDGYSGILGRCMIEQTWELYYDTFPCGDLQIPLGNLISVTLVEYVDPVTLVYTTWAASNYEVDAVSHPGWVIPVDGWPTIADTSNAVRVTFKAGYGTAATDVPAAICHAMKMLVADWFEGREGVGDVPPAVKSLLEPFRRVGF